MEITTVKFLENKTILVTGATGFLAKIFVEKMLRVQPNVKKLYLLLRAADSKSATQRFNNEIMGKDLFRVVKEKWGANLNSLLSEKVTPVAGDISLEDLGVNDTKLKEEMWKEIDIIVNLAATTNFDERYDIALGINTLGPKHVLKFAKKCAKIMVFVHVSTAYVCGEREGLLLEKPFYMGETLNGTSRLDIDAEFKIMEEKLNELRSNGATEEAITSAMKDLGIERAKMHGWPNTYVFTKSMGEMLVGHLKDNMPLVILRPTVITSTYKEPFPGWVEGIRTIDSLAAGYGKGKLTFFIGDPKSIIDAIPADMVTNSIILAMEANANQPGEVIYQVGSSLRKPLKYSEIQDFGYTYFTNKPWVNKDGSIVKVGKVKVMTSIASFHRYMSLRYLTLLKGLELANTAFCHTFQSQQTDLTRKIRFVMRMVELYQPYLFFKGVFDDTNTEKLRVESRAMENNQKDVFYSDPKCIDWEDYFINIHLPGLVKYVLK